MDLTGWQPTRLLQLWFDKTLDILFPPHCAACRKPGAWFCDECLSNIRIEIDTRCPEGIDACISLVPYANREMRALITKLKYQSAYCLMPAIKDIISNNKYRIANSSTAVTWAPASERRILERGIDHAELIAKMFDPMAKALLERSRHTLTNAHLEQPELRQGNVAGAFRAIGTIPDEVTLIDDVKTSGATASACAQALKSAGAKRVTLITLAYGG